MKIATLLVIFQITVSALAADPSTGVGFDQHLDRALPLEEIVRDESGSNMRLGNYFGERPAVLVLAYYECPNLCTIVLNGLLECVRDLSPTVGTDFDVLVLSIDPHETPALAAGKKLAYVRQYGRAGTEAGWHFLTADESTISRIAEAAGYRFRYDEASGQFAHPSGILVITPQGHISQYLLGIEYPPEKMSSALQHAAENKPGSIAQNLLLLCFHYDPSTGRYTPIISRILQTGGVATVLAIAGIAIALERRKRRTAP